MPEKNHLHRWRVVFGATLIQLCLGAIYAWSVFTPGLIEAGWSKLQTQLVFSVGLASFALVMVWAGRKLPVWGPRRLVWTGGVVLGLGYVMAGLLDATNVLVVTACIGVVGGAGIGMGYVVPIAVGMRWFPDRKGLITGLAVAGFGFGAMGWIKLAGAWGGLLADFGLGTTFVIYGLAFAALVLVGGIWMVDPPAGWRPTGSEPAPGNATTPAKGSVEFRPGLMLETPQFYLIFLAFTICAGAGLMSIGLMKLYPVEALVASGIPSAEAGGIAGTAMAVFFSIANGLGRIAWGSISDRIGRKRSLLIMATSQGFVIMAFTVMAGDPYLLYLGAALIGFNFGGNFALFPTITADTFGTRSVGRNYPFVFLAYGVGGLLGPVLGGMLGDMGNFPLAFSLCGTACIFGAVCISMVRPPRSAREEDETLGPEDAEPCSAAAGVNFSHRALEADDAPAICRFPQTERELFYMFPRAVPPLTPEQLLKTAQQRLEPTVALCGGELAGYVNFISCAVSGNCVLGNLVVAPAFRRRGVAAYLVRVLEEKARVLHGATVLRADCFNTNSAALLFYGRLGFVPVGMEVRQDPDGASVALLQLEKKL